MSKKIHEKVICYIDTETTTKFWNVAGPVEVAGLIVNPDGTELDTFVERIRTPFAIDPDASKVHGIYNRDLRTCRTEWDVLRDFMAWIIGNGVEVIITYNGNTFDLPMLQKRFEACRMPDNFFTDFEVIDGKDTVFAARRADVFGLKSMGRKWNLGLVASTLGMSNEGAHNALADVRMLHKIFFKLDPIMNPERW